MLKIQSECGPTETETKRAKKKGYEHCLSALIN